MKAMFDFEAIQEGDLSFKQGDRMLVTVENDKDWWEAVNVASGEMGAIPRNYVTPDNDDKESQTWWFDIDRHEAETLLMLPGNPRGTYLVRPSRDGKSEVLSVKNFDSSSASEIDIKHYRIRRVQNDPSSSVYIVKTRKFPTIGKLIENHHRKADRLCYKLVTVCPRRPEQIPFKQLEVNRSEIELTDRLGSGKFGEVWKGTWLGSMPVAVKQLTPGQMTKNDFVSEAKLLHRLRHRHLVLLMGVCTVSEPIYIIMELLPNGALNIYLQSPPGRQLEFPVLIHFSTQIAEGMAYVEEQRHIHRDLRSANILVGDNDIVKIADLGLARLLREDYYNPHSNMAFPVKWTAPEAANDQKFSIKSDVWSFGILLYEILTYGRQPYVGMTAGEALQAVTDGYRLPNPADSKPAGQFECPPELYDEMKHCWETKPDDRPSFSDLREFFNRYRAGLDEYQFED